MHPDGHRGHAQGTFWISAHSGRYHVAALKHHRHAASQEPLTSFISI
ncbi:hypothetical protein P879_03427 [Paragonimus westermani]|uniref:Uncharacterized protein n=1 Tax=Paragonimus westermani TaxID=34504 RepID=A0A8T0DHV1_9TREM|nr:hypothetical protein P879_03427 [Paragonimus westermani]